MSPWQELLWEWPSQPWWTLALAFMSAGVALSGFVTMIWRQQFNALMVGQCIVNAGAAMGIFVVGNSGALQWSYATILLGLGWSHFLISTNWCNRPHPMRDLMLDIGRVLGRLLDLVAPRDRRGPHDAVALHRDAHTGKGD